MKTIMKLLAPCLMIAGSAKAEPVWVKTPYWQVPIEKNLVVKIVSADKRLEQVCADYRDLVVSENGGTDLDAAEIDQQRKDAPGISPASFNVVFKVDAIKTKQLIQTSVDLVNASAANFGDQDLLPSFNLKAAEILPQMLPRGEAVIVSAKGSLTNISKSAGLRIDRPIFRGEDNLTTVKVQGKDVACDLLSGRAGIEFESMSKVKISLDDQRRSDEFYHGIEDLTKSVFAKKSSSVGRAALFGFRLSETLSSLRVSGTRAEEMIGNLVDLLFDQEMHRTALWAESNGEPHLVVNGSAQAVTHIRMEK